mgnify:CR=1 FL=1
MKAVVLLFSKKYQDLTKEELEKLQYLKFRQEPTVKKSPTKKEINDFLNVNNYAIWIDGVNVNNSKLNSYKPSDFASFSGSVILKNALTGAVTQVKDFKEGLNISLKPSEAIIYSF